LIGSWLRARRALRGLLDSGNQPHRLLAALGMPLGSTPPSDLPVLFCLTTGRSGSETLSRYLAGQIPEAVAEHEPRPQVNGALLDEIRRRGFEATRPARRIKLKAIGRAVGRSQPTLYAETSHLFGKTFYDVIAEHFTDLRVVVLRREPASTMRSLLSLGYFSNRNPSWRGWMDTTDLPGGIPLGAAGGMPESRSGGHTEAEMRAARYLIDCDWRAERFLEDHPSVRSVEIHLEETDRWAAELTCLLDDLLKTPLRGGPRAANARGTRKGQLGVQPDAARVQAALAQVAGEAGERGLLERLPPRWSELA